MAKDFLESYFEEIPRNPVAYTFKAVSKSEAA